MGFKVGDEYREHPWSTKPGGVIVVVEREDGKVLEYTNIKNPPAYIKTALQNPEVRRAYKKY